MFIPDQWYAVLESNEVKAGKPQAFKRLGMELVFWRDSAGQVVAMEDRCPHRQAKLSLGKVVDGCIECPFHGFRFDQQGACQLIPANGKNGPRPKIFQTSNFPIQEKHGFIWLWYGETRSEYPPIPFFDNENLDEYAYGSVSVTWNTHITRVVENLLDVAHLPFVHANTIGRGGRTLVEGPFTELENDLLAVWVDNQLDEGQPAIKGNQLERPNRHWSLAFRFPNIWMLYISEGMKLFVAMVPIDEENTKIYNRSYYAFGKKWPARLRKTVAQFSSLTNLYILHQDQGVATSQTPKIGGLESGDKYIPADRPIVMYYNHARKLTEEAATTRRPTELPTREYTVEEQLAG